MRVLLMIYALSPHLEYTMNAIPVPLKELLSSFWSVVKKSFVMNVSFVSVCFSTVAMIILFWILILFCIFYNYEVLKCVLNMKPWLQLKITPKKCEVESFEIHHECTVQSQPEAGWPRTYTFFTVIVTLLNWPNWNFLEQPNLFSPIT